jgi:hypothetical protein
MNLFGISKSSDNDLKLRKSGEANFLSDAIKQIQMNKMVALLQFFTIIGLIFLLIVISGQQKIITIINHDGETITLRSQNLSSDVLRRQVLYYSREVIENYFDLDYRTAVENRNGLKKIMSASLVDLKFGKENHIVENKTVQEAVTNRYTTRYEWLILPWVSSLDYPYVTVFGQIKRYVIREGYKPFEDLKNVKLVFQHFKDRPDPFGHPHDLQLISVDEIDIENTEFKNAINKRK